MIRLYFTVLILPFVIIPHTVDSFFLQNVATINVTNNFTCYVDTNGTLSSGFQRCAIRVYHGAIAGDATFALYNGLRYSNIFSEFIQKRCTDDTNSWNGSIGFDRGCDVTQPYETYNYVQICICATNMCNQNWTTCQQSVNSTANIQPLIDLIPLLDTAIHCDDTLNASNTCTEQPFINISACQDYVKKNSVLCTITMTGTQTIQTALIGDNYAAFLDQQIYQVKSAYSMDLVKAYTETYTNVFYEYTSNSLGLVEGCVCTNYSLCNQNISTCVPQPASQGQTTNSTSGSMTSQNFIQTSQATSMVSTTMATATNSTGSSESTSLTTSMTNIIQTSQSASMVSTAMATATNSTASLASALPTTSMANLVQTSESATMVSTTMATATNSNGSLAPTSMTNMMTTMSTNSSTPPMSLTTTTQASAIAPSTSGQSSGTGESGIGRSATAGIACGIVFSAVIFTAEIVFFKFCYSASNGFGRSAAYLA